nr:hypothetical protein [Actinomycetota bacterium]
MGEELEAKQTLFSVSGTNKHSTEKEDLKPGDFVAFKGSGAVVGIVYEGFADDTKIPTRIYRITCDNLELV